MSLLAPNPGDVTVCKLTLGLWHVSEESVRQRDALISEIQQLKQAAEEEKDKLVVFHQSELRQLETELNACNEDSLHRREFSSVHHLLLD